MDRKPLLAKEVASALRCSRRQVYDLFKEGELEGYRIGSSIRIYADSVTHYMDRHANTKAPVATDTGPTNYNTPSDFKPPTLPLHPSKNRRQPPPSCGLRHLRLSP